ncbi:MAG TPA: DUF4388 domain-containing protein [Pyrinomonadaceae bacterium]|nr:DUF4388 domain-containing protein [Pyrinomonadaceae bacterium]
MSDIQNAQGILDFIQHITSNRQTGQLEIISSGSRGALLFSDGKLVDARLGSLTGFQAVNAAASLRDVQFSFNPLLSAPRSGSIAPAERVVLKRFFGIETAEIDEVDNQVEPEIDWNTTPHQVVPLTEVDDIDPNDLQETPTVEVKRVASPIREEALPETAFLTKRSPFLRSPVAISLILLVVMAAGAIVLIARLKARRESAVVASTVAEQSSSAPESTVAEVKKEPLPAPTILAQQQSPRAQRDADVQDLTGEWRVINTVQKTAYKSYDNMKLGFRLTIEQTGKDFTARGEKVSENGRNLPAGSRTPISVTGSIDGDKVVADFVETGATRKTNGRFTWRLQPENAALNGTFVSAAANSSGKSAATRQP